MWNWKEQRIWGVKALGSKSNSATSQLCDFGEVHWALKSTGLEDVLPGPCCKVLWSCLSLALDNLSKQYFLCLGGYWIFSDGKWELPMDLVHQVHSPLKCIATSSSLASSFILSLITSIWQVCLNFQSSLPSSFLVGWVGLENNDAYVHWGF